MAEIDKTNAMKRVPHSGEIDMRAWGFTDDEKGHGLTELLLKGVAAIVTSVLREQFDDDPPRLWLPFQWSDGDGIGGPPVEDPAMLYCTMQLGEDEEGVVYACSLEWVIDDFMELHRNFRTNLIDDPKGKAVCAKLAKRLRELADKVDAASAASE